MEYDKPMQLLGGLSPNEFMRDYWQKKPLLIRQAFPDFKMPIPLEKLRTLASFEGVESRLVRRDNEQWLLDRGPLDDIPSSETPNWSLLVQSMDVHEQSFYDMAQKFSFIPYARFDDVMISLASFGGGVGPHFDTYDVFLLQGHGIRNWKISQQEDQELIPDLPCRILKNFKPEQEWVLQPGDMLYLPPQCAHDGVAETADCVTISFGFRTLSLANMARGVLEAAIDQISIQSGLGIGLYSQPVIDGFSVEGLYSDPNQNAPLNPAQIPESMIEKSLEALNKIKFNDKLASRFLGCWLTEPNKVAEFEFNEEELNIEDMDPETILKLDKKTKMLYRNDEVYINGEVVEVPINEVFKTLADERQITAELANTCDEDTFEILHRWLDDGWLVCA
ncbi:JmjC domain-containing protein [Taylorella equigenitalis]|uniref:JmjC domain-containing protein n=2 Tax=Taylorella equigenitalis TaxID=29575 RepID=A0A654KI55_TAYEM|nr:cupin domain-containing protein [Taylorella equigenitalis]ADU92112.1 hypothetical protein TEQUI_1189 [Taylorella equigenitalis MCE9]ASY30320.1 cupin [Taylorella equigenitalis]ASY37625.1 cupin domain-containing protein [Taylorella equigenitalis]ASY40612.1 cupin [Taylorella equigenitalis]ASY42047.1 cupin [Taylorella equigenitalis]